MTYKYIQKVKQMKLKQPGELTPDEHEEYDERAGLVQHLLSATQVDLEIFRLAKLHKKWKSSQWEFYSTDVRTNGGSEKVKRGYGGLEYIDGNFE